jgi:hypothetical protein
MGTKGFGAEPSGESAALIDDQLQLDTVRSEQI